MSMAAFTLGLVLLAAVSATQTYWAFTFLSLATIPFGMDMSFPAATVIMSNTLPKDQQGMAGSLVSTVINYSISLGLGFAATVEVFTNKGGRTREDILNGFKGAWYLGVGLGALGLLVALAFLLREVRHARRRWAAIEEHQLSSEQKLQLSLTGTLTPSLRTGPGQTTLAQRDSRSVSILPDYDGQPPLPSPRSSVWQMFEQEKEMI
jgi:MFS family permease